MTKDKHLIKKTHCIVNELQPLLTRLQNISDIQRIIPGTIQQHPNSKANPAVLTIQRDIISGFKILGHTKESIQEFFIVVSKDRRAFVRNEIEKVNQK